MWANAMRKGIKDKSFKTFIANNPVSQLIYMPASLAAGASLGSAYFTHVWKNGDYDSKFIEQIGQKEFQKMSPLERQKYGTHAFKPIYVKIGNKKVSINPYNYYKYIGRALSAEDKLMFRTAYEMEMASLIRQNSVDKGLRGKELRKAVFEQVRKKHIDEDAVNTQMEKEMQDYKDIHGTVMPKTMQKIRKGEIMDKYMDVSMKEEATDLARSSIFTDDRHGLIASTANLMAKIMGLNKAVAIGLKPHIPFTKIVGNVGEYMMDHVPFYGIQRAMGYGFSNIGKAFDETLKSSQMGERGSVKYYEQMGRAWMGTVTFIVAGTLFLGTDDDDYIEITGGFLQSKDWGRSEEMSKPKYSIRIGDVWISYQNYPSLAIPLSIIGNMNDYAKTETAKEELKEMGPLRIAYSMLNVENLMYMTATIKDMSFLGGMQNLIEAMGDMIGFGEEIKSSSYEEGDEVEVSSRILKGLKKIFKQYMGMPGSISPLSNNLVRQVWKVFDPESFPQSDLKEVMLYSLNIQRFTSKPALDLFGDSVKSYPAEGLIPYTHWTGIKGKDPRWNFLNKYNAVPSKVTNAPSNIYNNETGEYEYRKMTEDEFYQYTKKTGQYFKELLDEYIDSFDPGDDEYNLQKIEVNGKSRTMIQFRVLDAYKIARIRAREDVLSN
jgi:hypothetical protein